MKGRPVGRQKVKHFTKECGGGRKTLGNTGGAARTAKARCSRRRLDLD